MPLNFPSSPNINATYSFSDKNWTYNGNAWVVSTSTLNTSIVPESSNLYFTNARVYANVTQLGYITSSSLSGYATNAQLTSYATTANSLSQFASTTSAQLATLISDETGTGNLVLGTSPVLITPNIGTPSYAVLTSATGLPILTGVSGLGTNVANFLGFPTSANLISTVTDETGTGSLVFATTPTLITPILGLATGTSAMLSANIGAAAGNVSGNFTAGTLQTTGNVNAGNLRVVTNSSVGTVVSGTWQGTSIATTYTAAKIVSVSNTAPISATTTSGAVTVSLQASGVTAGTYGNATISGVFTVDTFGRITSASNAATTPGVSTGKSIAMAIVFGG